jgi:hypothetical protein
VADGNKAGAAIVKPMHPTPIYWAQSDGTFAIATYDIHSEKYPYYTFNAPNGGHPFPVNYLGVIRHVSQFQDYFTYPDPTAANPKNTGSRELDWGYTWTNAGYQVIDDLLPLPTHVYYAASPQALGSPSSILTGSNIDLSATPYVPLLP